MFTSIVLLAMPVLGAPANPDCRVDDRGVVARFEVASCVFLTEAGVGVIAPDWRGSLGDQQALEPNTVQVTQQAGETIYSSVLEEQANRTRLRQVVRPIPRGVRLEYELTPEVEMAALRR